MQQNKLFNKTRKRLAFSYAGVMGLILTLLGLGVYKAISHAHWMALDRELESVAGTLHDSLELRLKQPGQLEPLVYELLPNLCKISLNCLKVPKKSHRHILTALNKGNYYIRLFDTSGHLFAVAGNYPQGLSTVLKKEYLQTLTDDERNTYHQISVSLHTENRESWGYFQVGRTIKDFEEYLSMVRWILALGIPFSLILIGVASWYLSGLAMQPIYQSYQKIQQFTADAAHELRTPLAASRAIVEAALARTYLEEKETQDILKTLERQNQRLTQLVTDLLLLARIDEQSISVNQQICCLNDLVNDLVEELAALAKASDVLLLAEIRVDYLLEVRGDLDQLYRLVSNLIINAIQYTPKGGQVIVRLESNKDQAILQVEDTGIGIASQEQEKIFNRLYRVNIDRSRQTGGAGLGLAIAKAIIKAHQGSLTLQSELGKGSIFTVKLSIYTDYSRDMKYL